LSAKKSPDGKYNGIAPGANLVSVGAFDRDGLSSYLRVIGAIEWVVQNKDAYDIRILNLSFGAAPVSHYWDDPLNQAVMAAWQAGIVVVASAGNDGPDPMTIGVPGNVPYIITVGAMSDGYTPTTPDDDYLTYYLDGLEGDGFFWSDAFVDLEGFLWSDGLTETMGSSRWVEGE
jgi:serine protease AprX